MANRRERFVGPENGAKSAMRTRMRCERRTFALTRSMGSVEIVSVCQRNSGGSDAQIIAQLTIPAPAPHANVVTT